MKPGKNFLAGLINSGWSALLAILVVPFYLSSLGVEAYGLIGFFVMLQSVLALLDFGLAPTMNREVARCSATGALAEARTLLHTLSVVYWGTAAVLALLVMMLAPWVANHWLQASKISGEALARAVMLMGVVVAARWPIALYQGTLMGLQRLTVASKVSIAMTTVGNLGAVGVLSLISPTIEAFFMWQAAVAVLQVVVMRRVAWRHLGREGSGGFDLQALNRIWRFSAGMSGVAISGVILSQLDKALLSRMVSLEDFGRYTLAVTFAGGLYVFLIPLYNTIFPRMSALIAAGDQAQLETFYRTGTRVFLAFFLPAAASAMVFSEELLRLWTGNLELAAAASPILSFILAGTTLNGIMHFPYALQLAAGEIQLPLKINAVLIVLVVPLIFVLTKILGVLGGAVCWAVLNLIYFFLGTFMTHRRLLTGVGTRWAFADVGLPMAVTVLVVASGALCIKALDVHYLARLALAGVPLVMSVALTLVLSKQARGLVVGMVRSASARPAQLPTS